MRRIAVLLVGAMAWTAAVQVTAVRAAGSLEPLQQFSDGLAELASRANPAVVAVQTEVVQKNPGAAVNPFAGTPFEDFFRGNPHFRMPEGEQRRQGLGSGVIVSADGYILTNNHVVTATDGKTEAQSITVELVDRRTFTATIAGRDPLSDVAVLKIEGENLPTIPYGDSEALRVGEVVVALGNPFGQLHTVTTGIVSALGRSGLDLTTYESFIQTDAAINPGNSGGALVNTRGELIGINTAIVSRSGGYQGIGFAIPINMARSIMEQLVEHGEVRRGLLGVYIQEITADLAKGLGMGQSRGVLITSVNEDGPADRAGVKRDDIVLEVDGVPTNSRAELQNRIAMTPPGTKVRLKILRDGKEKTFTVELGQLDPEQQVASTTPGRFEDLGLAVQELTDDMARQLGYEGEEGVLVADVQRGSLAARSALRPGDLVQEVNRQTVASVAAFRRAIEGGRDREVALLLVRRGEGTRYVPLRMPGR